MLTGFAVCRRLNVPVFLILIGVVFFMAGIPSSVQAQRPVVTSATPNPACQGEKVTITGSNFTKATIVRIGSLDATNVTVVDDNTITAVVHENALNGQVWVTSPDGTSTNNLPINIRPAPKPALSDVGFKDGPFTNCDGSSTYVLEVSNSSSAISGTGYSYTINWGDNSPPFTQNDWPIGARTSHTYNAHGFFNVVISITAPNGCTRSTTHRFYNGKNPLASITTTHPTTGLCVPSPVEFEIGNWSSNTAGTYYMLDFGDNTPRVRLEHPLNPNGIAHLFSHTYNTTSCPNAADFTARLQAINGCFTTTYTLDQIIIRKKPEADFTTNPLQPCVNTQVCFNNTTANGFSGNSCATNSNFVWDFGDGATSTANSPCHTYTSPGTYKVKLTASNASCGGGSVEKMITVLDKSPAPTVTPVTYCQGQPAAQLTATGANLLWYSSATGGTGSPNAPTPSTNAAGTFTWYVSQTGAGRCEGPRAALTVTVNPSPAAPAVTTPVQLCQGQPASALTATGANLKWYEAATGGSALAAAPTPNTSTPGSKTWYVSQTVNGCEGPRAAIEVIVNSLATAPVVTSPLHICQGDVALPLTATGTSLKWYDVPTGGTALPAAPIPNTAVTGSKTWYVSQVTGCGEGPRASITVHVNPRPAATISYTPSILCNINNGPVAVIHTGTTGGTYTIVPASGLGIDATTGQINPANATPGTYTIRYTIPGSGGCANYVATTTVTISSTPSATIAYPAICSSDGVTQVQRTGSGGGIYRSDAGLTIDANTGAITPASSTPGMHTVTYEIPPSGPCPGFSTTAQVTITQAPTATIAYTPAVVCNVQSAPVAVTRTGTPGGAYSITPATGLTINTGTGDINPANATPGTYTIKYSVTGTGGCRNFETTTTVTVNGAPTATIEYAAAPYCTGNTTPQKVTLTGTTGGTFTAPAGLSINANTGDVNASLSTPGSYTVTYTIAAAPPCPGFVTTTNIEIIESPVIGFPVTSETICSGQTASFLPTSSLPNTNFSWAVVGQLPANVQGLTSGNVSGAHPSINLTFTNTGAGSQTIDVQVIAANPAQGVCASTPQTIRVTVHPLPPAPVADTFHLCMAAPPEALHVDPIPGATIRWYDQNGVLLNAPPVINTSLPAQFVYFVSHVFNNGCESPKTKMLAIVHPTARIVGTSYSNPTSCGIPSGAIVLDVLDLNNNGIPHLPVTVHYEKFQVQYAAPANTDATGKITIPLVAGTYSGIYVETGIGCMSQQIPDVFVLNDPNPPAQPIAGYNPPICSGTPLQLTALSPSGSTAGPIDYVWAGPAFGPLGDTSRNTNVVFPSAQLSHSGTYIVYAVQNNCISLPSTFTVEVKQAPSKPIISTRNPLCVGDDLVLQAASAMPGNSPVIEYTWKGPGRGFPVYSSVAHLDGVRIEDGGIYTVTALAPATGCSASTDTLIQIGAYPIVQFPQDTITLPTGFLLKLAPVITNAAEPGVMPMKNFAWTPSQNVMCNDDVCSTPVATIKNNACYVVKATNVYGCSGSDTMCVKVFCTGSQVFIPNAFAPNGNLAENTRLIVRATGIASVKSFRVFNRWGKVVFEKNNFAPNDPSYGWDGRINGRMADPGVYIYTVDVICENNVPYTYKGDVTLF